MKSYLLCRRQRVRIDNVFSEWKPITAGVPQGSLLGPLLFYIFINDFNDFITTVPLRLYADDTTEYYADYSPMVLNYIINTVKTQALVIGTNTYKYEFWLGDTPVKIKDSLKILGVIIDSNLTFEEHLKI